MVGRFSGPVGLTGEAGCAGGACSCRAWVGVPVLLVVAGLPHCCVALAVVTARSVADGAGTEGSAAGAVSGAEVDSGGCAIGSLGVEEGFAFA